MAWGAQRRRPHDALIFGILVVISIVFNSAVFPESLNIFRHQKRDNQSVIILQNACLETQIYSNLTVNHQFITLSGKPENLSSIPLLGDFDIPVTHKVNHIPLPNGCEFLNGSFVLFKRSSVTNFVHWMHELFLLYQKLDATQGPWQVFHLPSERKFVSAADLSYLQLVSLLGVQHQYSVFRNIQNLSLLHADEVTADAIPTSRCSCFSKLVAGKGGGWPGTPLSKQLAATLGRFVQQIVKSLELDPADLKRKPRCPQPQILLLNRPYGQPRHIVNLATISSQLRIKGIDNLVFHDLDGMTFRQQVQLAMQNISILVTPHGQGLWLSYFLPDTSAIVEIFPHGMFYDSFRRIAENRRISRYLQYTVPNLPYTNQTVHPRGIRHSKNELMNRYGFSEEKADSVVNRMYAILRKASNYTSIASFLVKEIGVDETVAGGMAKVFAREQMILAPSVEEIVTIVQELVLQMTRRHCKTHRHIY